MKKCPQCSREYTDDNLAYCLEDGAMLVASYQPNQIDTPTVAINQFAPPPTVAAQGGEIPTVVHANQQNPFHPAAPQAPPDFGFPQQQQTPGLGFNQAQQMPQADNRPVVRGYVYPVGFAISVLIYLLIFFAVQPAYYSFAYPTASYFGKSMAGDSKMAEYFSGMFMIATLKPLLYGLIAFLFGFFWSKGGWKWGLIIILPELIYRFYLIIRYGLQYPSELPLFIFLPIFFLMVTTPVACSSALVGSFIKRKITKQA